MDRCEVKRCRAEADITYLGHGVCERHWNELTADDAPPDALRTVLGIEAMLDAAMEDSMGTSTRKKAAKPTKKVEAKEPKTKRESIENPVVFAFRLSEADRTKIHEAAGSGKATRFVRTAALAAANGDTQAFEELVAQAKTNLK